MLSGHYELPLVLISIVVAVLASYTALSLAGRVSHSEGRAKAGWIAGGAFAMGTGIWSMHFVGMLAFRLPIPLGYDLGITLLSWLLPVAVSAVALRQLGRESLGWRRLAASAVLIGLGINLMHYVGMAAMRMSPAIRWDPLLVAASIAIAIVASAASLWIAFHLRRQDKPYLVARRGVAALAMGGAIVGMHYTGMAAANFPEGSVCRAATSQFGLTELALLVIVGTVAVLAIALLTSVFDARMEARGEVLSLSQQTARERQLLLERERSARAEAERLSALKDEFLATLSHELRTPLNAVLGWVQLLRLRRDEASLAKGLETIERNARLQAQLIDDLLDMSRIISGHVRLQRELIDAATLAEAAIETAQPAAFARQVAIEPRLQRAAMVWGDPARLQQVMWNLLSNAVKFTPAGGHVRVTLGMDQAEVLLEVSDDGIGISAEFLPHVFDRFRQADASTSRRHGGLGLGLAITRELVQLHGGTITAESAGPGQGASFKVRLPRGRADAAAPGQPPPREAPLPAVPGLTRLDGLSVLVVDDEPDARQMLEELLATAGARVGLAADAPAGLQALEQDAYDVLVSDIGMPVVDGFELVRRLRSHPDARVAATPAIALTAFAAPRDRERALAAGFDGYLPKPLEAAEVLARVAQLAAPAAQPGP